MVKPITRREIHRENMKMFNRGEINLTSSINEVVTREDEAVRWFVRVYSQGMTVRISARKVLLALSSIATVENGIIIATVDERTKRIMSTCLEISEHEFDETLKDLLDKKVIDGIEGCKIQIHPWFIGDKDEEGTKLVRIETKLEPPNGDKNRAFTTSFVKVTESD